MKKENIPFLIIGVLLGFIGGFVLANQINRSSAVNAAATQTSSLPTGPMAAPTADSLNHGSIPNNSGMLPDVQKKIEKAKNEPDNFEAQIAAGEMFAKIQRFDKSLEYFERANNIKPDDYQALVLLGNANFDMNKYEESEKWYVKALEKKPDDIAVRTDLGLSFFLRERPDFDRAIKEYKLSLEKDPNHEKTLQNLSAAYNAKGDKQAYEETLARLEKVNPQNPAIRRMRGENQQEQKPIQ